MRTIFTLCTAYAAASLTLPGIASAHLGHVGEVAGHTHWIGIAALGLAAGVAALLPSRKRKKAEDGSKEQDVQGEKESKAA